ncbi:MAG TPA: ABC transporter substrate-binding protein [Bacillota bacterium]|nr:ABC transporter substrate-binding protein [Bacillota bacterium]
MKNRFAFVVSLLLVAAMLFGCNTTPKKEIPTAIRIGTAADIIQLVPFLSTDAPSGDVHQLIHEGLIAYKDNYEIIPALAETWETSTDGTAWTFHLRKDVLFQNGDPFTSADVKFTYEQILDPAIKSNAFKNYSIINKIDTPDDLTVVFTLASAFGPFLGRMSMGILDQKYITENNYNTNNYNGYNQAPIGTGAWKMTEWVPETSLTLSANETYWGDKPILKTVVFKPIPEASVRLIAFKNGEIDYIAGISPDDVAAVAAETTKYTVFSYPQLRFAYLAWNNQYGVFQDKAIRQALTYATDKDTIISSVINGYGVKANTTFAPNHSYYKAVDELYPYDPAKAIQTLEDAGYTKGSDGIYVSPDGVRAAFETMVTTSDETFTQIALLLQQSFKTIGVEMTIKTMERSAMYAIMDDVILNGADNATYQSMVGSMGPEADPDQSRYLHSDGGLNDYRYKNATVDAMLIAGSTETDPAKRAVIYDELQDYLAEDLPMLFLYFPYANNALSNAFTGMNASPYGLLANLKTVTPAK